jgi:hypoxanthine phosphoribosyltransferase
LRVLIIDNIVDSGRTIQFAVDHIKGFNPSVVDTFVLVQKDESKFEPTFIMQTVPSDQWVTFDWNQKSSQNSIIDHMNITQKPKDA